jgi:hypothetical protein
MNDRKAMKAIFYVARTGCQWGALPRSFGAKSTVHDRFQEWRDAEVFQNMWREGLLEYDQIKGIDWEWQAIDDSLTKPPLGEKHRTNPNGQSKIRSQEKIRPDGVRKMPVIAAAIKSSPTRARSDLINASQKMPTRKWLEL